jgi:hypothetical protein
MNFFQLETRKERKMKIKLLSSFLFIATALSGSQGFAEYAQKPMASREKALVQGICTKVMKIPEGTELVACADSLAESLAIELKATSALTNDKYCSTEGFSAGTPAFYGCVLDRQAADRANGIPVGDGPDASSDLRAAPGEIGRYSEMYSGTYFDASPAEKRTAREYSCAMLGLDPNGAAFFECVANLDKALRPEIHISDS